jgi:nitrate reductase NapD
LPKAEVTHQAGDGRLVAVLEAASASGVMQQLDRIRSLKGVLNVALVYQHAEPEEELGKEIEA